MLKDWTKIFVTNREESNTIYTAPNNYYEYKEIIIFFSNNQTDRRVYDGIATNCTASVNQASSLMGAVITLTDFTGIPTYQFQMYGSNSPYIIVYGIK